MSHPGRALALRVLTLFVAWLPLNAANPPRVQYPDSTAEVAAQSAPVIPGRARILRANLTGAETAAPMDLEVALKMRNFAELQARVARGEIISRDEMAAKYFPLAADYEAMAAWLAAQGLTITHTDSTRLSVFVRGTISQIKDVFQVSFARVAHEGGEYSSAITAPSVPVGLAMPLLGINGLQPYLRPHQMTPGLLATKASLTSNNPPYTPAQILRAYSANSLGLTGAGQTIAIVIDTYVTTSDITTFWSQCGINQIPANIQQVRVSGTPTPPDPSVNGNGIEATIDVELTSSLAPAAKIRVYTTGQLDSTYLSLAYEQIYNELPSNPALHQVDLSYGSAERDVTSSRKQSDAQRFLALASAGVTVFASSGDGGSRPTSGQSSEGDYSSTATLQPSHPASDPSVTGVGATSLTINQASGAYSGEVGWSIGSYSSGLAGSGGGISRFFARPSWQTGAGVPSDPTPMRLVPDVSVDGDPSTGAYIVYNGSGQIPYGGTSISSPLWTGFGALINQARSNLGLSSIGLLGPKIYPLIGTASLHDITSGSNGTDGIYPAGVGYDMVTGVGTPNMANLVPALAPNTAPPFIAAQPASQTVTPGQIATFSLTVNGGSPFTYLWQREPAGSSAWSDLGDSTTYTGTTTDTLTVNPVTEAMNGDQFQCVVSNAYGTATTSPPAALVAIYPLVISTLAGQAGSGGSTDGTGVAARFNHPSDLVADSSGNVFVTDTNNQTIRKITPAGTVTTLAGAAGSSGSTDGTGSAARFNNPTGITIDGAGNLYVADTDNNSIRRVVISTGVVSTVSGGFNHPSDVTVDASGGNIYVADTLDNSIRKISGGTVTTVASSLAAPEGVAVDSAGNLYVADTNSHSIKKISGGVVSTLAGLPGTSGSSDGVGSVARFQHPSDLALDSAGNLYVADTDNHTIRKVSASGLTGTVAGLAGSNGASDGTGASAMFYYPAGVAVDSSGKVYVADTNNQTVRQGVLSSVLRIVTQPQSQTATAGTNVSFSVVAAGAPTLGYQWYFNGSAISGAISSTLSLTSVQASNAGNYTVIVSNSSGSVTSSVATLTVNAVTPASTSGGGGGGGGGGLMQAWFVLALALLGAARSVLRKYRTASSS